MNTVLHLGLEGGCVAEVRLLASLALLNPRVGRVREGYLEKLGRREGFFIQWLNTPHVLSADISTNQ